MTLESIELLFTALGGIAAVCGVIFALGKLLGKTEVKESVDSSKMDEIDNQLSKLIIKYEELKDSLKDVEHKGDLGQQTIKVLQGQIEVLFKLSEKQGEKMEKFFDQMLELGKEK